MNVNRLAALTHERSARSTVILLFRSISRKFTTPQSLLDREINTLKVFNKKLPTHYFLLNGKSLRRSKCGAPHTIKIEGTFVLFHSYTGVQKFIASILIKLEYNYLCFIWWLP